MSYLTIIFKILLEIEFPQPTFFRVSYQISTNIETFFFLGQSEQEHLVAAIYNFLTYWLP